MDTNSKRTSMIKVKGGFSDTKGIASYSTGIQVDEFDNRTRTLLSNTLYYIVEKYYNCNPIKSSFVNGFCKNVLSDVLGESNRKNYEYFYEITNLFESKINMVLLRAPYNEVLDVIWYIVNWLSNNYKTYSVDPFERFNQEFEQESVGYRFVNGQIVQITDPIEIDEIEQAAKNRFEGCRNHIKKAVEYLSNRETKDYKNVVKESISAVESICKVITGNGSATLGDALNFLKNKRKLNPILKVAFEKLYAYTNDQGGIRHADGLFTSEVTFEEAKFMLVSCSAFVNYLISEYGKTIGA